MQRAHRLLARRLGPQADHQPGVHRLRLAFQLQRNGRLELGRVGDGQGGRRSHHHPARRSRRLQSRSRVDRVAGHTALVGAALCGDRLTGVDAHAQLQCAVLEAQLDAQLLDRVDEGQSCAHGAHSVVIACPRHAEDGHRGIADELLETAAVAGYRLAHCGKVAVLDRRHVLRVVLLGQRREANEVSEKNADDAPLERRLVCHVRIVRGRPRPAP